MINYSAAVVHLLPAPADNSQVINARKVWMTEDTLGERVKAMLEDRGITQAELGRKSGVGKQNVWRITKGGAVGQIAPATLFALADTLGVNARWLALGSGPQDRDQKIDKARLLAIFDDVVRATGRYGKPWPTSRALSLSLDLYSLWEKTGEHPSIDQTVQLLEGQH